MGNEMRELITQRGLLTEDQIKYLEYSELKKFNVLQDGDITAFIMQASRNPEMRSLEHDAHYLITYLIEGAPKDIRDLLSRQTIRNGIMMGDKVYDQNDVLLQMRSFCGDVEDAFLEKQAKSELEQKELDINEPFVKEMLSQFMSDMSAKERYSRISEDLDTIQLVSKNKESVLLGLALLIMNEKMNPTDRTKTLLLNNIDMWKLQAILLKYIHKLGPMVISECDIKDSNTEESGDDFDPVGD